MVSCKVTARSPQSAVSIHHTPHWHSAAGSSPLWAPATSGVTAGGFCVAWIVWWKMMASWKIGEKSLGLLLLASGALPSCLEESAPRSHAMSGAGGSSEEAQNSPTTGGSSKSATGGGAGASGNSPPENSGGSVAGCDVSEVYVFEDVEAGVLSSFMLDDDFTESEGAWALYGDTTSESLVVDTSEVHASGGSNAARCQGGPFTLWGGGCFAGFWPQPIDVKRHRYNGFQFWARADAPVVIRVNIVDQTSSPDGGICQSAGPECEENCCFDHYGFEVEIGTTWTLQRVLFDDLWREDENGPDLSFNAAEIHQIDFRAPVGVEFQFDLDDLAFFNCE